MASAQHSSSMQTQADQQGVVLPSLKQDNTIQDTIETIQPPDSELAYFYFIFANTPSWFVNHSTMPAYSNL
ncbi:hypothetical protein JTE90_025363 [Oedothorax gibbosus]|uniref:Uncharacterized protein n=1 Tax=Oedothorax gibbosus TaxID=931172 RepID=A0AAV6U9Z7_9ARAC|nr:hypothetical protein JTE90_025363 [Oedothorax gibbosus]